MRVAAMGTGTSPRWPGLSPLLTWLGRFSSSSWKQEPCSSKGGCQCSPPPAQRVPGCLHVLGTLLSHLLSPQPGTRWGWGPWYLLGGGRPLPLYPWAGSRHRRGTVTAGWGHAVGPQRCPGSLGVGQHPAGHCSPKSQPKGSQQGGDRGGSESPASPRCPFLLSTLHRPLCGTLSAEPTSTTHQHQGHQLRGHRLRGHQLRGHLW